MSPLNLWRSRSLCGARSRFQERFVPMTRKLNVMLMNRRLAGVSGVLRSLSTAGRVLRKGEESAFTRRITMSFWKALRAMSPIWVYTRNALAHLAMYAQLQPHFGHCPNCRSTHLWWSRTKWSELPLRIMFIRPYRCWCCRYRGYLLLLPFGSPTRVTVRHWR